MRFTTATIVAVAALAGTTSAGLMRPTEPEAVALSGNQARDASENAQLLPRKKKTGSGSGSGGSSNKKTTKKADPVKTTKAADPVKTTKAADPVKTTTKAADPPKTTTTKAAITKAKTTSSHAPSTTAKSSTSVKTSSSTRDSSSTAISSSSSTRTSTGAATLTTDDGTDATGGIATGTVRTTGSLSAITSGTIIDSATVTGIPTNTLTGAQTATPSSLSLSGSSTGLLTDGTSLTITSGATTFATSTLSATTGTETSTATDDGAACAYTPRATVTGIKRWFMPRATPVANAPGCNDPVVAPINQASIPNSATCAGTGKFGSATNVYSRQNILDAVKQGTRYMGREFIATKGKYPHEFGDSDTNVNLLAICKAGKAGFTIQEFPIIAGKVVDVGKNSKLDVGLDRVTFMINKDTTETYYCGIMTHSSASKDANGNLPFRDCTTS